jgi:hypothetical protein
MRAAFTIVELIVVVLIAGVLLALLFPAVQSARESAARSTCTNNLRQIGLALQNYHNAMGTLPPALIWFPRGEPLGDGILPIGVLDRIQLGRDLHDDRIYANWLILLLPFLDQHQIWSAFDLGRPISDDRNAAARATELSVLKCPSDPFNDEHFFRGLVVGIADQEYARGNYAINVGPDGNCVSGVGIPCEKGFFIRGKNLLRDNDQVWGSGAAGVNKSFSFAAFSDGAANTVLVDEIRVGIDPIDPRGVWALGQVGSSLIARHGNWDDAGRPNPASPYSEEFIGCTALIEKLGASLLTSTVMGCYPRGDGREANLQAAARSLHPHGVNVLFGDASVRFMGNDIDAQVWHAIHTRDGNESLDPGFYSSLHSD